MQSAPGFYKGHVWNYNPGIQLPKLGLWFAVQLNWRAYQVDVSIQHLRGTDVAKLNNKSIKRESYPPWHVLHRDVGQEVMLPLYFSFLSAQLIKLFDVY